MQLGEVGRCASTGDRSSWTGSRVPAGACRSGQLGTKSKGPHRSQERCGPEWSTGRPTDLLGTVSPACCWQVNTPPAETPVLVTRGSITPLRAVRGCFRHAELCSRRSAAGECCDCGAWRKQHRAVPGLWGCPLVDLIMRGSGEPASPDPRTRDRRAAPRLLAESDPLPALFNAAGGMSR